MIELDRCYIGDVRAELGKMIDAGVKVNCIVTSPPYWGLRSYLQPGHPDKVRELGSEPTLREFLETMVGVFDLCRQVLADDGVMWVNMGDSYSGGGRGGDSGASTMHSPQPAHSTSTARDAGLPAKNLVGQPWRLAFALQDAGWILRQDIVWAKGNPMPESVRDRCTKAHEYVFLFAKQPRYYWDFQAMQEPVTGTAHARRAINGVGFGYAESDPKPRTIKAPAGWDTSTGGGGHGAFHKDGRAPPMPDTYRGSIPGRKDGPGQDRRSSNARGQGVGHRQGPPGNPAPKSLLADTENPGAYADGKSERMGRGAGWRERKLAEAGSGTKNNDSFEEAMSGVVGTRNRRSVWTIPSEPYSGAHFATFPSALVEPCILAGSRPGDTVLDPFMGSGTVAMVAQRPGRRWLGIDIDERNLALQADRIGSQQALDLA